MMIAIMRLLSHDFYSPTLKFYKHMNHTQDICFLCKQKKELKLSHIIPNFVGNWIKETSATGLLRGVINPNKRLQDSPKIKLLCGDCEQIISKYESYFANKIFYPFFQDDIEDFEYDDNLIKFIISLAWRILLFTYDVQVEKDPWIKDHLDLAEETWRRFLLGNEALDESFEHHLLFLDYIESSDNIPNDFDWYTLRGADATLVSNNDTVFCYVHLPWMIMVSTIFPKKSKGWINTQIHSHGKLTKKAFVEDSMFGNFLIQRISNAIGYKRDDSRIVNSMLKNPDRLLQSETLKTFLSEERRKRNRNLPESLLHLIELLEGTQKNPELTEVDLNFLSFHYNFIADRLSSVSKQEAMNIHNIIVSMIKRSDITKPDVRCKFIVNGVHVQYLVNYCSSKEAQRQIIKEEMLKLSKQNPTDSEYYLIVSFNPLEPESKFEMGAYFSQ